MGMERDPFAVGRPGCGKILVITGDDWKQRGDAVRIRIDENVSRIEIERPICETPATVGKRDLLSVRTPHRNFGAEDYVFRIAAAYWNCRHRIADGVVCPVETSAGERGVVIIDTGS